MRNGRIVLSWWMLLVELVIYCPVERAASLATARHTQAMVSTSTVLVGALPVHKVHLRSSDISSPWSYAATINPLAVPANGNEIANESSLSSQPYPRLNFLATQVWPSARAASTMMERYLKYIIDSSNDHYCVCELGCGPGLPSITAVNLGVPKVIATDIDPMALMLVNAAAKEQVEISRLQQQQQQSFSTGIFDLTLPQKDTNSDIGTGKTTTTTTSTTAATTTTTPTFTSLPQADLYIMSDIFESATVAYGAAYYTCEALRHGSKVWIFTQSDRAQRNIYISELVQFLKNEEELTLFSQTCEAMLQKIKWLPMDSIGIQEIKNCLLLLVDVDELSVIY